MAYDPVRQVTLLFGGARADGTTLGDTWTWDGTTWTEHHLAVKPPAREEASMVLDRAIGKIVLFGGKARTNNYLNDTWTWDGNAWSRASDEGAPSSREAAAMAYDEVKKTVLLYGGDAEIQHFDSGSLSSSEPNDLSDTWTWDGDRWKQQVAPAPKVSGFAMAMAYDVPRGRAILCCPPYGPPSWAWDGTTWTEIPGAQVAFNAKSVLADAPALGAALAFDRGNRMVVAFGGSPLYSNLVNDTWTWDGSVWKQANPTVRPGVRFGTAITYDERSRRIVIFGGHLSIDPIKTMWRQAATILMVLPLASTAALAFNVGHLRRRIPGFRSSRQGIVLLTWVGYLLLLVVTLGLLVQWGGDWHWLCQDCAA